MPSNTYKKKRLSYSLTVNSIRAVNFILYLVDFILSIMKNFRLFLIPLLAIPIFNMPPACSANSMYEQAESNNWDQIKAFFAIFKSSFRASYKDHREDLEREDLFLLHIFIKVFSKQISHESVPQSYSPAVLADLKAMYEQIFEKQLKKYPRSPYIIEYPGWMPLIISILIIPALILVKLGFADLDSKRLWIFFIGSLLYTIAQSLVIIYRLINRFQFISEKMQDALTEEAQKARTNNPMRRGW